jgi:hypothetical protein
MAQSGNARAYEMDDQLETELAEGDDTSCPVCGANSKAYYSDKYGSYEFCKDCGWSDDAGPDRAEMSEDRGGRRDRNGRRGGRDEDF